jgi:hypothetical protein
MIENDNYFLPINIEDLISDTKKVIDKIWLSPSEMETEILSISKDIYLLEKTTVLVTGETKNISIYLARDKDLLVISPFSDLSSNVLLKRWNPFWAKDINCPIHYHFFKLDNKLHHLLVMPHILLINLSVVENFPIPRLNLSTGSIAAYLRYQQSARVSIIDMQKGQTVEEVVAECISRQPDLIGVSISFCQKKIAFSVIDKLFHKKSCCELKSLIVIGNVIPALSPNEFLERYPQVVISYREGENSLLDLANYLKGEMKIENVRGIIYKDCNTGTIKTTLTEAMDMSEIPTPALDTLKDIASLRGALTLETSRGCDYSKCTFCPREHKMSNWRFLSVEQILTQIDNIVRAGKALGIEPHIYFADEEFIGELPNGKEAERVINICEGLMLHPENIRFDTSARADSVYDPKRSVEWNIERIKMWSCCRKAGLDRLFVGVESGCDKQLQRFGKGTTAEQNIIALRILSALGINIRIGFVMYDQLMVGLCDIKENISFLERTDAIVKPINIDNITYEELYKLLLYDEDFIMSNSTGRPVYSVVSYMLASMEVLMGTKYVRMLQNIEKKNGPRLILNNGNPDANMGRYVVDFCDPLIGEISLASQKWIDSNFTIMYTIKSLYKVAPPSEKLHLYDYMVRHRQIGHYLLKYIIYALEQPSEMDNSLVSYLMKENFYEQIKNYEATRQNKCDDTELIIACMNQWQNIMYALVRKIRRELLSGLLTDTIDNRLQLAVDKWIENRGRWELINPPLFCI